MKTNPSIYINRAVIGFLAFSFLILFSTIFPAIAQQRTVRVGSEMAMNGLTVAEQAARSIRLYEGLMTIVPPGTTKAELRIDIDQTDLDALAEEPQPGFAPLRVGVVKPVKGKVGKGIRQAFNHGVIKKNEDGSFVWAIKLRSPGAQAIRVRLTDFSLPDSTEMYLLGSNGQAHGPYTGKGRNGNGDFWTRSIASDTGTLMLSYTGNTPDIDYSKISFTVSDIGHIRGRPPRGQEKNDDTWPCSDNDPCVVDVNCVEDIGPAAPAENAVAKMEWIISPYIYTCTGGLLVDTDDGTQIPYFLTANHCLTESNDTLETFFNYTTDQCNGGCPDGILTDPLNPPTASTIGVTVMATGSAGDFTLLTLDQAPPAGAVFLGWNNSLVAYTHGANLYRISNPNFGPQAYSKHIVDAESRTCSSWPRGERIYSKDEIGATMGGSSGSPVLNSASEVVGQLSGCCGYNCGDVCDSGSNLTVDGALAFYWDSVSEFLDPPQPECTTDVECDDGKFCNGTETCVSGSCQSSGDPCQDGEVCNETTDTCDAPDCNNDGTCEAGEDCNNCPNDCRQKTTGAPKNRYCCDGDLPDCGHAQCSESGWLCAGSGPAPCSEDSDCDDGSYCNGTETCDGGECADGSDPCPDQGCDEVNNLCVTCTAKKDPCTTNDECCSGKCHPTKKTCL